jgi:hypothetical protein
VKGLALFRGFTVDDERSATVLAVESVWNPPAATDEEISAALDQHAGLAFVDRSRMSRLLCEQLTYGIATRTLDSFAVTDVLEALEGHGPRAGHVVPSPFNHPPLRGLLHVHFVQASFIPQNLGNELRRRDGRAGRPGRCPAARGCRGPRRTG